MLILSSITDKISITTSAAGNIDVHSSYVDYTASTSAPDRKNLNTTAASTVDIVLAPAVSTQRNVRIITIRNKHATNANTITVIHTDGATAIELFKVVLQAGEVLVFNENIGFRVFDAAGQVKTNNRLDLLFVKNADTGNYIPLNMTGPDLAPAWNYGTAVP